MSNVIATPSTLPDATLDNVIAAPVDRDDAERAEIIGLFITEAKDDAERALLVNVKTLAEAGNLDALAVLNGLVASEDSDESDAVIANAARLFAAPVLAPPFVNVAETIPADSAKEDAILAETDARMTGLATLGIETKDRKDALARTVKFGNAIIAEHFKQLKSFGRDGQPADFGNLCSRLADRMNIRVATDAKDLMRDVRIAVWVGAAKTLNPNVATLSLYQVSQFFVSTLDFDPVSLTGTVKLAWADFVKEAIATQLSDKPLSIAALRKACTDHKSGLGKVKPVQTAEELAAAERKAELAKVEREKVAARASVTESVASALAANACDGTTLAALVNSAALAANVAMPKPTVQGIDPANVTMNDALALIDSIYARGDIATVRAINERTGRMLAAVAKLAPIANVA